MVRYINMLLESRKFAMIFFSGLTIGIMRFLRCSEVSQMYRFLIVFYSGAKGFFYQILSKYYPFKASCITFFYFLILIVGTLIGFSQILPLVITFIGVSVIHVFLGPLSGHPQPRKTMDKIKSSMYSKFKITIRNLTTACNLTGKSSVPPTCSRVEIRPIFPSKNPGFWVIVQKRANIFRSQIIAPISGLQYFWISHLVPPVRLWSGLPSALQRLGSPKYSLLGHERQPA